MTPDGSLYYLARGNGGQVYRIDFTGSQAPNITDQPDDVSVALGQSATFSVTATGNPAPTYQWQRNQVNIAGATSSSFTIAAVTADDHNDLFRVVVSNSLGTVFSREALLTVMGNSPPVATITQPAAGTLYVAGTTINYAGTGTDAQDGTLPPGTFTWRVDFHHDTQFHPFIPDTSGATSGSFVIPNRGETSANVWYRIHLTVLDSQNATSSTFVDLHPRTVTLTVRATPNGPQVTLDGQPANGGVTAVAGMIREIGAPTLQTIGDSIFTFKSWSDGGAPTHEITVPAVSTTYTARFQRSKVRGEREP